jgi:hypothetical protein
MNENQKIETFANTRWAIGLAVMLIGLTVGWGMSVERRITANATTLAIISSSLVEINTNIKEMNKTISRLGGSQ